MIGVRAAIRGKRLRLYRLDLPADEARELLMAYVGRINRLAEELTMRDPHGAQDTETVSVWVTESNRERSEAALLVEGNGVYLPSAMGAPNAFDHTDFGAVGIGRTLERRYRISNQRTTAIELERSHALTIAGEHAGDFKIMSQPRLSLAGGGSTTFSIRFKPSAVGSRTALVRIGSGAQRVEFDIAGAGVRTEK